RAWCHFALGRDRPSCLHHRGRHSHNRAQTRFRLAAISFTVGEVRRGHPEGTRAPPHLPNAGGLGRLRRPKPPPKSVKFARTLSHRGNSLLSLAGEQATNPGSSSAAG